MQQHSRLGSVTNSRDRSSSADDFNAPQGLTHESRVGLLIESDYPPQNVKLNDSSIRISANHSIEILNRLQPTNQLELCFLLSAEKNSCEPA